MAFARTAAAAMPAAGAPQPDRLLFAGPHQAIALNAPAEVIAALEDLIPLWPPLDDGGTPSHEITAWQDDAGWHVARHISRPAKAVVGDAHAAANEIVSCLIGCCLAQQKGLLCLHAAAVEIRGGLMVLLGTNHAGKSTLSAAMAALGHRFMSDDELLVDLNGAVPVGIALGTALKLRLPLPAGAPPWFRAFVDAHRDVEWSRGATLYLDPAAAAGNGERLPIAALIDLRRRDDAATPQLQKVSRGDAARLLLDQLMAPKLQLPELVSTAAAQVRDRACYRLSYADSFAAAELLSRHFPPAGEP